MSQAEPLHGELLRNARTARASLNARRARSGVDLEDLVHSREVYTRCSAMTSLRLVLRPADHVRPAAVRDERDRLGLAEAVERDEVSLVGRVKDPVGRCREVSGEATDEIAITAP